MLELPESYTVARQLNETVQGRKIQRVCTGNSPHKFAFFTGNPETYHDKLQGKELQSAYPVSGLVELCAEDYRITIGDGTNLRYLAPGDKLPVKYQLLFELDDGSALVCSVQMYGGMWVFRDGENDNPYYLVAKEKPTPLTEAFNEPYFQQIYQQAKPSLSVKALLATEQQIPGLGNGVLQDILFNAQINPRRKIDTLSEAELDTLFQSIRITLASMAEKGGRDTEKDLFGNSGGYQTILSNKTWKNPCPACGGAIERKAFLGGTVYYCPTCQPL